MKSENLIHVKFEYAEAVESKRDVLSAEKDFLKLLKIIKRYHKLRSDELRTKEKIGKKIKELKTSLSKLNQTLPKVEIPEILQEEYTPEEKVKLSVKKSDEDYDIESQIAEIQNRLKKLE